jgi:hypothetical protein
MDKRRNAMLERTDTMLTYTKALLALCPLLTISQKQIQEATSATSGHVSNWHTGRRTITPAAERTLFGLLTEGAKHLPTRAWPNDHAALADLHAIMSRLLDFDGIALKAERAHAARVHTFAPPMLRWLNAQLEGAVDPSRRRHLTQTRDAMLALVEYEDRNAMQEEWKARHRLLRALAEDLAAPTIPLSVKVVKMSEALQQYFGDRVWDTEPEPTSPTPAEERPAQRTRRGVRQA